MNRSQDDKYLNSLKKRYAKASKKERGQILDEYVQTTGCHRKYAAAVLSGQYQWAPCPIHRPRHTLYTAEDARALDDISDIFDAINAKLLRAAMDVELDPWVESRVLKISPACHERMLTDGNVVELNDEAIPAVKDKAIGHNLFAQLARFAVARLGAVYEKVSRHLAHPRP